VTVFLRVEKINKTVSAELREIAEEMWLATNRAANDFEIHCAKAIETLNSDQAEESLDLKLDTPGFGRSAGPIQPLRSPTGVFFVPWADQTSQAVRTDDVVRSWLSVTDSARLPLVLIAHFPADAVDSLLAVEAIFRADPRLPFTSVDGDTHAEIRSRLAELSTSRRTTILLDLSRLSTDGAPGETGALWQQIRGINRSGRRIVVALHRQLLSHADVYEAIDGEGIRCYIADVLFKPQYELRQPFRQFNDPDGKPSATSLLLDQLLRANSTALPRALSAEMEQILGTSDNGVEPTIRALLNTAKRLCRGGYLEPAYRLELYARTRETYSRTIALSADLLPMKEDHPPLMGFLDSLDELPALMPRSILSGADGSGKSCGLTRIAHSWSMPKVSHHGIEHPSWLPVVLDYGEGAEPEEILRDNLISFSRYTENTSFRSEELDAHARLSRLARPENLRWLVSSPVLFLIDGIRIYHRRAGEWLDSLHQRSAPDAGLVIAWDLSREPRRQDWVDRVLGRGIRAHIRRLTESQFHNIVGNNADRDRMRRLQEMVDRPIAAAIRNPYSFNLVREAISRGESVENWNLHDIVEADVRTRVGVSPDFEVAEVVERWLPAVALAQRENRTPPVDPAKVELAIDMGLLRRGNDLQFTQNVLRDYFAAREIARQARSGPPASVIGAILDRAKENSAESWTNYWEGPLSILAGRSRELCTILIQELTRRDPRLALRCARQLPWPIGTSLSVRSSTSMARMKASSQTAMCGSHTHRTSTTRPNSCPR
jgi:hypothetical protein